MRQVFARWMFLFKLINKNGLVIIIVFYFMKFQIFKICKRYLTFFAFPLIFPCFLFSQCKVTRSTVLYLMVRVDSTFSSSSVTSKIPLVCNWLTSLYTYREMHSFLCNCIKPIFFLNNI